MPRSKPKETIVHRIELGTYERTRLDEIAGAYQINRIATPAVDLLRDGTAMIGVLAIVTFLWPGWKKDPATDEDLTDQQLLWVIDDEKKLDDWIDGQNLIAMALGGAAAFGVTAWVLGGPPGILVGSIVTGAGIIGGALTQEGIEEFQSDAERAKIAAKRQIQVIKLMVDLGYRDLRSDPKLVL